MKIYTKKGDKGKTSLIGGTRVPKYHIRIEAYGTVDELNSYVGLIRDHIVGKKEEDILKEIQDRLFTLGSLLASDPEKSRMKLPELKESDVELLENEMDRMNESLPELTHFVLPGGHPIASYCHLARCVCRRAERLSVHLNDEEPVEPIVITYLNRLSDYFFVLARLQTLVNKGVEYKWIPKI
ncbi:MAG: cob(I)alamin adenosyltransferase [Sphingobacteriales bacterium]|jgi:cob(I)alamin adenosyltransferase